MAGARGVAGREGGQQERVRPEAQAARRLFQPAGKGGAGGGFLRAGGPCGVPGVQRSAPSQLNRLLRRSSGTESGGFSPISAKKP